MRGEDAVVAGGVIAQRVTQLLSSSGWHCPRRPADDPGRRAVLRDGVLGGQPGADAAAQRDQLLAAQLLDQPGVAGEHHAQQRLRVEAGAGHQAQLAQHGRAHLLRLVDQQHGAPACGLQVRQPALAQAS